MFLLGSQSRSDSLSSKERTPGTIRLPMRYRKEVATIILLIAVAAEFVGISMGTPVMAKYVETFGVDPSNVGVVFSVGASAAILSDLWLPYVSDFVGRKAIIVASLTGSAIAFAMQAVAPSYRFLLLAMFFGGMLGGTQPVAVAYISDIFPPKARPRFIGMVPAVASACYTIGPTLGGIISNLTQSFRVTIASSAVLVFMILPIVVIFLPDSADLVVSQEERKGLREAEVIEGRRCRRRSVVVGMGTSKWVEKQEIQPNSPSESTPLVLSKGDDKPKKTGGDDPVVSEYKGVLRDWRCQLSFLVQLFSTGVLASFVTCIPLIIAEPEFGLEDEQQVVFLTGIVIGCGAGAQSLGLALIFDRLQRRVGLTRAVLFGSCACFVAVFLLSFQRTVLGMAICFPLFTLGNSLVRPGNFSYVTTIVPREYTARAIAMPNVATSLAQMIAPIASTKILAWRDYITLFQISSAFLLAQVIMVVFFPEPSETAEDEEGGGEDVSDEDNGDLTENLALSNQSIHAQKLAVRLIDACQRRHYDLDDQKTRSVVVELFSRSLPYLRDDAIGKKEDLDNLARELDIEVDMPWSEPSSPPQTHSIREDRFRLDTSITYSSARRRVSAVGVSF